MKAILKFCLVLAIAKLALGQLVSSFYNAAAPRYFPPQATWKFNPTNTIALDKWNHLYVMRGAADNVTNKLTGDIGHNFAQRINGAIGLLAKHNLLTNTVG